MVHGAIAVKASFLRMAHPLPGTFWTITKKFKLFPGGGFAPQTPPFKSAAVAASARQVRTLEPSRPLSRPPGGGRKYTWSMVWNVDHRTARSSPTRPADSGTFFWAQECQVWVFVDIISCIFRFFCKTLLEQSSRMGPPKKFRNLQAWLGDPGQVSAQT